MNLRRLILALAAAAALITLAVPASALAATQAPGASSALGSASAPAGTSRPAGAAETARSHPFRPVFKAKQATCHHVRSAPAGTKRCTQIQRLPLKDLSSGQLAQRRRDMAKAEAQAKAAAPRASAQPDIAEPSQCGFSTIEYALTAVRHPDRFTSCSDNLWVAVNWEVTAQWWTA